MTTIAVPELRRYAPDALRVVGIPQGQADETAEMLVWTEAVVGGAVAFLRIHRARLWWVPRPRLRLVEEGPDDVVIDARGGSLLEFGVRIADFLASEALVRGVRTMRVDNVYGQVFVPYLVARAADLGVTVTTSTLQRIEPTAADDLEPRVSMLFEVSPDTPVRRGDVRADAFDRAVERGIDLPDADFASLVALFEMLRVPTSERSRSHAG